MVNKNITIKNSARLGGSPTHNEHLFLFLTNIRTSQRERITDAIKTKRQLMYGKQFKVRPSPPKFCKKNSIAIIEFDNNKAINKVTLSKIYCRSWTCPRCNVIKALKVKYLIKHTAILNNLEYFLTLTLDPNKIPNYYLSDKWNHTHSYITKLFNTFITDLKRKVTNPSEKIKYIWVIEFQKNGNAHLHILLNKFIDINLIREIWVRIGGGHIMKVENVKTIEGISSYVSDYIVKGIKNDISDNSCRKYYEKRYSISHFCKRPVKNITLKNEDIADVLQKLKDMGIESVYNALEKEEYDEQLILFDKK